MKIIVSTLALVIALLLNACGKEADETTTESPAQAPATEQMATPAQEMKDEAATETMTGDAATEEESASGEAETATDEAATMTEGTAEDAGTMEAMPQAEEANEQPAAEESK